jgi:hypothetical protein
MGSFPQVSLVRQAYNHGNLSRENARMRVSPFYEERVMIGGKRIDVTIMLDIFWLAGYDGEAYPEQTKDDITAEEALNALDATPNPVPFVERIAADA